MSREDPTPEEVDAILAYQHGAYGVNLPDWYTKPSDLQEPGMISDEAVEAACDFLAGSNGGAFRPDREFVRKVLEAAAPHMLAEADASNILSETWERGFNHSTLGGHADDNPYRSQP